MSIRLFLFLICWNTSTYAQKYLSDILYTADPAARVFNDTLYVYTSHDKEDARWFNMSDWHVFSSTDLQKWTDHGIVLSLDSITWASKLAWAPDCVYQNNRYYFYYPVDKKYIGVAVSNRPTGPFKDSLRQPLICKQTPGVTANRGLIDPVVFIDDDKTPYLLFGQNDLNIVRLNKNMVSLAEPVRAIKGAHYFFEAAWMHKYQGKYYLSYSGKNKLAARAKIRYAIGDSPYGPFQYKGVILSKVNSGTNHASIVDYQHTWYLFYHTADLYYQKHPKSLQLNKKKWYRRSVSFQELHYNADGTIQKIRVK